MKTVIPELAEQIVLHQKEFCDLLGGNRQLAILYHESAM